jgi:hypothetical protein
MNATLVGMVDEDEGEETLKPLIDGGTEGASGANQVSQGRH